MFLFLHIIAGCICLLTGLLAMISRKKKGIHSLAGEVYHWSFVVVFATSIIMALLNWRESAYLFFIGIFSYSFALSGYIAAKRKKRNWIGAHIGGMLGSYIAIITAVIVVNAPKLELLNDIPILLLWFLPTIIGSPLIFLTRRTYATRKKMPSSKNI
ncbi:DUF2306 domain-containing protein [Metabacillus iocasae]|uniref:Membrane protein n=1 Tax=Priestia iocasae TaxID=2291674 RepID=A0ABS2QV71_9BACI|nr:putative membrane protein [Metabacillus iocasae]